MLAAGGLLMAAGVAGVDVAARHAGTGTSPWLLVPGLVIAGAGLALVVIPLVSVVLAAVPAEAAGGASGMFSTAQQLGGAIGVAAAGTIFFGGLSGHSFVSAFLHTAPWTAGAFVICAALSLVLPSTAAADAEAG